MDKNSITGFLLIGLLMFAFSWFNKPSQEQIDADRRYNDSISALVNQEIEKQETALDFLATVDPAADSVRAARLTQEYGQLAQAMMGENQTIEIENEVFKLSFDTKGGNLSRAELKQYDRYDSLPLVLFDAQTDRYGLSLTTAASRVINTNELFFKPVVTTAEKVVMRLYAAQDAYLDFVYTIQPDSYLVSFNMEQHNMGTILSPTAAHLFSWEQRLRRQEKGRRFEEQYSNLFYKPVDDDVDYLSAGSNEKETFAEPLRWIGYKNQFFTTVLLSKEGFSDAILDSRVIKNDPNYLKTFKSQANVALNLSQKIAGEYLFYLGPNDYPLLQDINDELKATYGKVELDELVPLGASIFRWVNEYIVITVFTLLGKFIHNYGIIILLLTIIIKLILWPFTYKSFMSQAKMRVLKPEIQKIADKYPGQENAMARQQATTKLYSEAGINPMGGCLPMLLQMPILFAMFQFFPSSIELRGQSFLWAHDLSSYDSIYSWTTHIPLVSDYFGNHISLFCLLMTVTNLIYIRLNMQSNSMGSEQMPGMKAVQYMMPVMFMVFFNNYASGLSYYYFVSLLITIGQTYAFRLFVNEDKLRAEMKAHARNPKKKTGFMARLEEAQRLQQENIKRQQQNKK